MASPFLVVVLILAVSMAAARNVIVRAGLQEGMKLTTGLKLDIGQLDIGISEPTVDINDLKLFNSSGYADPIMAQVGRIDLRYRPEALLSAKVHLKSLSLALKRLFIIRRGGQLNVDVLKGLTKAQGGPSTLTIDDFSLDIGQVVYKNYDHDPVVAKTYDLNFSEHFVHVHGGSNLWRLIIRGVSDKTSVVSAVEGDLGKLTYSIKGILGKI